MAACVAAGGALAVIGWSPGAGAETRTIQGEILILTEPHPGPNDPNRCLGAAIVRFREQRGATSYQVLVKGFKGSHDVSATGPPVPADHLVNGPQVVDAPAGTHQVVLGLSSYGSGCGAIEADSAGRFAIAYIRAGFGDRALIKGRITDDEGVPVIERVTLIARGKRTFTATTGPNGRYEIKVPAAAVGAYTVTPGRAGLKFTPVSRRVVTRKGDTVSANFNAEGPCKIASARAAQAKINPREGLYADAPHEGRVVVNYSCRTRELIVRVDRLPAKLVCREPTRLYTTKVPGGVLYSNLIAVAHDGTFSGRKGRAWSFSGYFRNTSKATVTVENRDCDIAITQDVTWVADPPYQF